MDVEFLSKQFYNLAIAFRQKIDTSLLSSIHAIELETCMSVLSGSQILVVEDNEELQGILADFLDVKQAEADFASNGELGLSLALSHTFDAIILDVMMPKKMECRWHENCALKAARHLFSC